MAFHVKWGGGINYFFSDAALSCFLLWASFSFYGFLQFLMSSFVLSATPQGRGHGLVGGHLLHVQKIPVLIPSLSRDQVLGDVKNIFLRVTNNQKKRTGLDRPEGLTVYQAVSCVPRKQPNQLSLFLFSLSKIPSIALDQTPRKQNSSHKCKVCP